MEGWMDECEREQERESEREREREGVKGRNYILQAKSKRRKEMQGGREVGMRKK